MPSPARRIINALILLATEHTVDLPAALASYRAEGFARLGRLASAAALDALRARADALMLGQVVYPGLFFQHDAPSGRYEDVEVGKGWVGPSLAYRKLEKLEKDPLFLDWMRNPLFAQVARALIPGPANLYRAILFNKAPGLGTPLPWHQDLGPMWGLSADPEVQLWTALDDAGPEGGCLEVLPGSHRWGLAGPLGGLVPPERAEEARADQRAVALPAQAGEVILLHNACWHRSGGNFGAGPRRALSVCLIPASTRCLRKRHAPRRFFPLFT